MSTILDTIAEAKRSLIAQLEQAEAELLGEASELEGRRSLLEQEILGKKKALGDVRKELSRLTSNGQGNGQVIAEKVESASLAEGIESSIPPEIEVDSTKKPGTLAAAACNTHGLKLNKIDDYILVILYNMNKVQEGMAATIDETLELLSGAGYKSNAVNFKSILYSAYNRLKEAKLVTTDKRPGRIAYYKITTRGVKSVGEQLSRVEKAQAKNAVDERTVLEAIQSPATLPDVIGHVVKVQKISIPDAKAFSQAVQEMLKGLVEDGKARIAGKRENLSLYARA
jgi:DNA-binding PadR family transcriptional regulator